MLLEIQETHPKSHPQTGDPCIGTTLPETGWVPGKMSVVTSSSSWMLLCRWVVNLNPAILYLLIFPATANRHHKPPPVLQEEQHHSCLLFAFSKERYTFHVPILSHCPSSAKKQTKKLGAAPFRELGRPLSEFVFVRRRNSNRFGTRTLARRAHFKILHIQRHLTKPVLSNELSPITKGQKRLWLPST